MTTESLDTRIAGLLKNPSDVSSTMFSAILVEIATAISHAEKTAADARTRAFDPAIVDGTARGKMEDAIYVSTRLKNATTALSAHLQAAVRREEQAAWNAEAEVLRKEVEELGANFKDTYMSAAASIVTVFRNAAALDQRVDALNVRAPIGVSPLRRVEAVARGIPSVTDKPFVMQVQLPKLPSFETAGQPAPLAWPPAQPNIGLAYTQMISEMIRGPAMLPPTEEQRAEAAARHIAHGQELERGRERANSEAAARAEEAATERRRAAAGG